MPTKPKSVTIAQIAQVAGVARSSVSRAFTRPELLKPDTVARIRQVAEQLGYVPNYNARALSTGRNGNIAFIVPDVANPYFPPMIRSAQLEADRRDYCVFLADFEENGLQETKLLERFSGKVEGVILVSSRMPEEQLLRHAERLPLVLINREVSGVPRVLIDAGSSLKEAVKLLAGLGHRHIAYLRGPAIAWANQQREASILEAAEEFELQVSLVQSRLPSLDSGREAVDALLASGVSGAIAFNDFLAQGVLTELAARGISVPQAFSLVGCDNAFGAYTHPPLTTVSNRTEDAGTLAFSLLMAVLKEIPETFEERQILATRLIQRETLAPPTSP